jgi:hypothetical protein
MKSFTLLPFACACVIVAGAFCPRANASVLFEDDFQSDTVGAQPVIGAGDVGGAWTITDSTADSTGVLVANAGGSQYAAIKRVDYTHDGTLWAGGYSTAATTNRDVTLNFSINKSSTESAFTIVSGFADTAQTGRSFSLYFWSSGAVWAYDEGTGQFTTSTVTLPTDSWQDVAVDVNTATRKYSLTVGGATDNSLGWTNAVNSVPMVFFGHGGDSGNVLVDNVQLSSVPEPSACVLLLSAATGLLAYAWRKRR